MSSDTRDERQLGPIDFLVVEFPAGSMTGEGLLLLVDLVDRGIIGILDLLFLRKDADGTVAVVDIGELEVEGSRGLSVFRGASSGLMGPDDVEEIGAVLEPGSAAAVIVYENLWAAPLATTLVRNGARLVAGGRIPAPELLAALDELDAEQAAAAGGGETVVPAASTAGGSRMTRE